MTIEAKSLEEINESMLTQVPFIINEKWTDIRWIKEEDMPSQKLKCMIKIKNILISMAMIKYCYINGTRIENINRCKHLKNLVLDKKVSLNQRERLHYPTNVFKTDNNFEIKFCSSKVILFHTRIKD